MLPSIFAYLPSHGHSLLEKCAGQQERPRVEPPAPVLQPPPSAGATALKNLALYGAGTLVGFGTGAGGYHLVKHLSGQPAFFQDAAKVGLIGSAAGALATAGGKLLHEALTSEMRRADQDYADYLARRTGSGRNPQVQPPEVRS
jgi:hypothetical protein